jgi:hypothetical protein
LVLPLLSNGIKVSVGFCQVYVFGVKGECSGNWVRSA